MAHPQHISLNAHGNSSSFTDHKLSVGDYFPDIMLTSERGEMISLQTKNNRPKLIVFYRGNFCDFCQESLREMNDRMDTFISEGIDVVAVSTDSVGESCQLADRLSLRFPIACGLTIAQMEEIGLFIHTRDPATSPKFAYSSTRKRLVDKQFTPVAHWQRPFCEPAHFFLKPNGTIKYFSQPDGLYHL